MSSQNSHFDPSILPISEVAVLLQTDQDLGLSKQEALQRLERDGKNKIEEEKKHPYRDFLISQIKDPTVLILFTALLIKLFTKGVTDAIAIGVVLIFNTALGLFQNVKAQNALNSLKNLMTRQARVIREGQNYMISSEDLVKGDVIYLESGMIIPADVRLIKTINFACDESMLTGESVPSEKDATISFHKPVSCQERKNMAFSGTVVSRGRAEAIVTSCGIHTELGKIAHSLYSIDESLSPLQIKLKEFSKRLSLGIVILVCTMVLVGLFQGYDLADLSLVALGLMVSAIPEGLPLAITLCLVIGIQKMAEQKALVKKLPAVETLGATTIICSDKTGTLTCNQMTVTHLGINGSLIDVTGVGYEPEGKVLSDGDFSKVALIAALAQETTLTLEKQGWVCHGDPTEASLIVLSKKLKFEQNGFLSHIVIPFESEKRFMASCAESNKEAYLLIKGSSDVVIDFCDQMLDVDGSIIPINKIAIEKNQKSLSDQALRTLALAYLPLNHPYQGQPISGAIFAAIVGIEDPLRDQMKETMACCKEAGIGVKMITGDHPHTALAIYKKLFGPQDYKIFKGEQIDKLNQQEKDQLLPTIDVFARVSPQNKLAIVESLKKQNHIVAMTGDGVNDSPCLKGAHIGIAMGSGSDVAKDVSDIILLDDNFSTLVKAVEMGRMIFKTLQNLITYLLITAASGVTTITLSIFFKWPLPLLPIQLLWINIVTDGSSTLPMCFEKLRPFLMQQKPHDKNTPIITKDKLIYMLTISLTMSLGTLFMYKYTLSNLGKPLEYAQSVAFTTLAFFQIWNVQNSRSLDEPNFFSFKHKDRILTRIPFRNNYPLLLTMALAFFLQVMAIENTHLQPFIRTVGIDNHQWIKICLFTFSIMIVSDLFKYVKFRFFHKG